MTATNYEFRQKKFEGRKEHSENSAAIKIIFFHKILFFAQKLTKNECVLALFSKLAHERRKAFQLMAT